MEKEGDFLVDKGEISLEEQIKAVAKKFLQKSDGKEVIVVSHFDTDGITSAAIMIKCLRRLDKKFSIKIVKSLEKPFIDSLPKDKIILFLDLSSGSLNHIEDAGLKEVFIIDHHELIQQVFEGIEIINPQLHNKEKINNSGEDTFSDINASALR